MKNLKLSIAAVLLLMAPPVLSQTTWGEFKPSYHVEALAGASMSMSYGKFIDDHKEFHEISYSSADIDGKVKPIFFFVAGVQGRFRPGDEGVFSKLSAALGIIYSQRGFNHVYEFNADYDGADIDDKMEYKEKYKVNQITVPVTVRYGKKWFVELGLSMNHFMSASRKQTLKREVSGSDAYEGGFETDEKEKVMLDKSLFDTKVTGLVLGLGMSMSDRTSLRLTNHLFTKTFDRGNDFKSYNLQLELIINLFNIPKQ